MYPVEGNSQVHLIERVDVIGIASGKKGHTLYTPNLHYINGVLSEYNDVFYKGICYACLTTITTTTNSTTTTIFLYFHC